jgi:hypothetical protein
MKADRLEALARLCIIRLNLGAGFPQSVEVQAAAPFEGGRGSEIEDRLGAFLDAAPRLDAGAAYHGRVHVGRGVRSVDGDAGAMEFASEINSEHDLRQLALAVGPRPAIAACQHDVREIDRLLSGRRHINDAGRRTLIEAVREAEAELDAAKGRSATNAAAKKLQRAREELRSAEAGAPMVKVRKPRADRGR